MNDVLDQVLQVGFLAAILRIATPLIFATLGEMLSERAGVLNLGIEGIMLISGGLAGLAGVGEVGGVHFQVMSDLSPGFGYSGIVIAMLARLNPLGVVPAAIFFAIVMTGAEAMSRATGVPVFLADVLQGTSLLAMLVALLFTSYRIRRAPA